MSGKRKSPPNKFDGDSIGSEDFEGSATETGTHLNFKSNLNEIALSAAKMQQQFANNNNNYHDNEVSGCNIFKNSDGEGEDEGEIKCEDEQVEAAGKGQEFMELEMGQVSASDGENAWLDIDARSIITGTSSSESEVDNASHVSASEMVIVLATTFN